MNVLAFLEGRWACSLQLRLIETCRWISQQHLAQVPHLVRRPFYNEFHAFLATLKIDFVWFTILDFWHSYKFSEALEQLHPVLFAAPSSSIPDPKATGSHSVVPPERPGPCKHKAYASQLGERPALTWKQWNEMWERVLLHVHHVSCPTRIVLQLEECCGAVFHGWDSFKSYYI
jgi:hypothetical protein